MIYALPNRIKALFALLVGSLGVAAFSLGQAPSDITAMEEQYFATHGHYLQVEPHNKKPEYTPDTLPSAIPDNVRIDVYEANEGHGYQVITETDTTIDSVGYGVEAKSRTYSIEKPPKFVSSTTTP